MSEKPQIIVDVLDSIENGDRLMAHEKLTELYEAMKSDLTLIKWVIVPANLNELQTAVIENFDIPRKALAVRNRVPDPKRRGLMFVHAINMAVKRTLDV